MSLEIVEPGFFTTVQDLGRFGFRSFGVSACGAMDTLALRAANLLISNEANAAGLEITLTGPRLRAREKCLVAVTGARFELHVNEQPAPMDTALFLRAGATLEFGARESGARAYLALQGGVDVPVILNSRSADVPGGFGGLEGRALRAGDVISPRSATVEVERAGASLPLAFTRYFEQGAPLRVMWGPHHEYFDDSARATFLRCSFTVHELSARMALRLRGERLSRDAKELLSCGMTRGAIQVPPDGQPIVLMADHQTTGGYPVIATVIDADLPRLGQQVAGDVISFQAVSLEDALRARGEIEEMLELVQH